MICGPTGGTASRRTGRQSPTGSRKRERPAPGSPGGPFHAHSDPLPGRGRRSRRSGLLGLLVMGRVGDLRGSSLWGADLAFCCWLAMGYDGPDRVFCGLCADSFRLRARELRAGEGAPDAGAESGFRGLGAAAVGFLTRGEATFSARVPLCCCPGHQQHSDGCALIGCRPGRCWRPSGACSGSDPRMTLGLATRRPSAALEPKRCQSHQVHCWTGALTVRTPLVTATGRHAAPWMELRTVMGFALQVVE